MDTALCDGLLADECELQYSLGVAASPACHRRISQRAWFADEDGVRTVGVGAVVVAQYDLSDTLGRNVAMWLLVKGKYAKQVEVASAFGLTSRQVNRLCKQAALAGMAGLVRKQRSDKTPEAVAERVCRLRKRGAKVSEIARKVALSPRTVRALLAERGLDYHDRASAQLSLALESEEGAEAAHAHRQELPQVRQVEAEEQASEAEASEADILGSEQEKLEAGVEFQSAYSVCGAGVLLAMAAERGVLLEEARNAYGQLGAGLYGLRAFVQGLLAMALLGLHNIEALKTKRPEELGLVLGLRRIFEVKTARRKLQEMGTRGKAEDWYHAVARRWVADAGNDIATLYVDGHTRAYYGKHSIAKGWCARRRLCQPATTDTWTNDSLGQPLLRITHEAHPTVAQVLPQVLADVRELVGPRRITVAFDRGGWSAATFKKLVAEQFDFVTYRSGQQALLPAEAFAEHSMADGTSTRVWRLADTRVNIHGYGEARQITIMTDKGKQTPIVTSNYDAAALDIVLQLLARWRQENYFKYMRQNYNIDALVDYATAPVEDREIPNPEYQQLSKQLARARTQLRKLQSRTQADTTQKQTTDNESECEHQIHELAAQIDQLLTQRKALPRRCMLSETSRADEVKLATERKLCSDLIKMAAYRAECELVRRLAGTFARTADEAHTLIRSIMQQTGDIRVEGTDVHVTLQPMSAPRFTRALVALCDAVNTDNPVYPDTHWRLHFHVTQNQK